jgi:hypothetical protein
LDFSDGGRTDRHSNWKEDKNLQSIKFINGLAGDGVIRQQASRVASFLLIAAAMALVGCAAGETAQQPAQSGGQAAGADWKAVEQAMGRPGALQPGDVYRFGMPRSDLKVTAKGVEIKPALALGSWAAFKMMGNQAMVR